MSPRFRAHRQKGVALITAMLVVAIAVIAATSVLDSGHFAIQRAGTLQDSEKAWGYVTGAEDWARTILQRDARISEHDSLDELWNIPQQLPVENGFIGGEIIDALSRFNLNNLGLADDQQAVVGQGDTAQTQFDVQVAIFTRLFDGIDGAPELMPQPRQLAEAIRDWIDEDQTPTGLGGREDRDYLTLIPPRRAANRPMSSVSELRNVLETQFDPESNNATKMYALLLPFVTALPVDGVTPINVNTAVPQLLMALSDQGPANSQLSGFVAIREEQPAVDNSSVSADLGLAATEIPQGLLTVSSRLFQLQLQAQIGNGRVALYSLIFRPETGVPVVHSRSTDTL